MFNTRGWGWGTWRPWRWAALLALAHTPVLAAGSGAAPAEGGVRGNDRGLRIEHLELDLRADVAKAEVQGTATLYLRATRAVQELALDGAQLEIQAVETQAGAKPKALRWAYDGSARDGALRVFPAQALEPGQGIKLHIRYRSTWQNHSDASSIWASTGVGLRGFAPTRTDPRKRTQLWASLDPHSARYWFPGIDDPAQWHSSELRITTDARFEVHAAGELASVKRNADGSRTWLWRASQPHRSHQTALVIGEYKVLKQPHRQVALQNWGYPSEMDGVAASVPRLPQVIDFFTELLATPFPQKSFRQVFVPDYPWGLPAPGLAMQSENMVDDAGTHADYKYLWNVLQAENAAAQWLSVKRGAADWRSYWIDRGFVRHLGGLWSAAVNGQDEFLLYTVQADHDTLMADWAAGGRETLSPPVTPDAAYLNGNRPFVRGGLFLHGLRHEMGDAAWTTTLRSLAAGRGALDAREIEREASQAAGRDLAWYFKQWLARADHPEFELRSEHDAARAELRLVIEQRQEAAPFQGHLVIDIAGRRERVWLDGQRSQSWVWPGHAQAPAWLALDPDGAWIKQRRGRAPLAELLAALRGSGDALVRHGAQTQLIALARDSGTSPAQREQIIEALKAVVQNRSLYWRARGNALGALRGLLQPTAAQAPWPLDDSTVQMLLRLISEERSWLRAGALGLLGNSRDPRHAGLYLSLLRDPSDRVILNAALALGKTGDERAFAALQALPSHPSWKNQSLVSALVGLEALNDARGIDIALGALLNRNAERWTLATPVWDHRLAAAQTLKSLGAGERGVAPLLPDLDDALAQGHVNDSLYNLQMLAALGQAQHAHVLAAVQRTQQRLGQVPGLAEALKGLGY
jgi:aminopeptidase N